jgi:formyl-CoA transferase
MIASPVPNGALKGLKVIDLTMMLAGPFATMLLGDQGATIIKIEPVKGGDMTRAL